MRAKLGWMTVLAVAVAAGAVGILLLTGDRGDDRTALDEGSPAHMMPSAAMAPSTAASASAPEPAKTERPRELTVRMGEWFFKPDPRTIKAGRMKIKLRNTGEIEHDLIIVKTDRPAGRMPMIEGEGRPDLDRAGRMMLGGHGHDAEVKQDIHTAPGGTQRLELRLGPGRYALVCSLPGHFQAGQYATLRVAR